jgi:hypothetical protein
LVIGWQILQHLAEFCLEPLRRKTGGLIQELVEGCTLEGEDAELRQDFLLTDTQSQSARLCQRQSRPRGSAR